MAKDPDKWLAFLRRTHEQLRPILEGASVPVVRVPETARPHGSGTLLAIGADVFLVTAAHVLVEHWERADPGPPFNLAIGAPHRKTKIIGLEGRAAWNRQFDVGVLLLSPECRARVLKDLAPIRMSMVDMDPAAPVGALCEVHGWPIEMTKPTARGLGFEPFIFRTVPFEGATDTFRNFDPAHQIALRYGRGGHAGSDGEPIRAPEGLQGISGCSIWRIIQVRGSMSAWTLDQVKVVAVQTGVVTLNPSSEAIVGTRWSKVAELIATQFPEFRSVLHLTIPGTIIGSSTHR